MAVEHDPTLEQFRAPCRTITGYYIVERYPTAAEYGPTEKEIRASLMAVQELIERLRKSTH